MLNLTKDLSVTFKNLSVTFKFNAFVIRARSDINVTFSGQTGAGDILPPIVTYTPSSDPLLDMHKKF